MIPTMVEQFGAFARGCPEPMLLLSSGRAILAASDEAGRTLGRPPGELVGRPFDELCESPAELAAYLALVSRTLDPLPGSLLINQRRFRCSAWRLTRQPDSALVIRFWERDEGESFVLLSQKIHELNVEVQRRREAERELVRMQLLTEALGEATTCDEVTAVVLDRGLAAVGATYGAVLLVDEEAGRLTFAGSVGYPAEVLAQFGGRIPLSADLPVSAAVRTRTAIFIDDPAESLRRFPRMATLDPPAPSQALVVLPLLVRGRPIAVVSYGYPQQQSFGRQREMAATFARQCAQALDRALLFDAEKRARIEAREAERRKDEFLAMLGHELRNPLAPILTASELMLMQDESAFRRERDIIQRQARHLASLVDDLLDVTRITRGKVVLHRELRDLGPTVVRAVDMVAPLLDAKAHRLAIDLPDGGLEVDADHDRLAQVLGNLLNNAANYTDPGGRIQLAAAREGDEVVIRVGDSGRGIEPSLMPHIFEPFVQDSRDPSRQLGGLGVGLSIVRSLVDLHGGSVSAESAGPGQGAVFTVRLPHREATADDRPQAAGEGLGAAASSAPPARILVVDDNADAGMMLAELLQALGCAAQAVEDGPAALRLIERDPPDLAFIDLGMPVMNGYELAALLRQGTATAAMPLVAITGYGQESDLARTRAAGFRAHLVKPVAVDRLIQVLRDLVPGLGDEP